MAYRCKNIIFLMLWLVILPLAGICQASLPIPVWVTDMGGPTGNCTSTSMKVDAQNNIYVIGIYSGTVDFDPSPVTTKYLTSTAGSFDGYVAKYKTDGTLIWAISLNGAGTEQPNGLDVANNGNITITGQFDSMFDVNAVIGVFNLSPAGGKDIFIIRIDSNGTLLWAKSIGGPGADNGNKVVSDVAGNLITVAQFQSTIKVNGTNFTAKGVTDGLIVKYDAAGNVIWDFSLGAVAGGDNSIIGVSVGNNNNIVVTGYLNGVVNFNPLGTPYNLSGNSSIFIAQYSSAGVLIWVKTIAGSSANNNINICLDAQNNIYVDGTFSASLDFGSSTILNQNGIQDLFFAKYSATGALQWYKGLGGSGAILNNYSIGVSNDNYIYISGFFSGTADFDPSTTAVSKLTAHTAGDLFLAKYDTNGYYTWAFGIGNSVCNNTVGRSLAINSDNDILLTGSFCSTINFDPNSCNTYNVTAQSSVRDLFIAKYTTTTLSTVNHINTSPAVVSFCGPGDPSAIIGTTLSGGVYSYQWQSSTDNLNFGDITGATANDYDPPVVTATTYYRRGVISSSCVMPSYSNVITIAVVVPFVNSITAPAVTSFCATGNPDIITGTAPASGTYSYRWQSSTDNINFTDINGANARDYDPPVITATTYYRRTINTGACIAPILSTSVSITIVGAPVFGVSAVAPICLGSNVTLNAFGGATYKWVPATGLSDANIANPVATPKVTTTYTAIITTGGCSNTASVTVIVIPKPIVNAGTDEAILTGSKVQLSGTVTGSGVQYNWSPATYLDNPNVLNPVASPLTDITYTLTATSPQGCFIVSDNVAVKIYDTITLPNAFTPNGDGVNDTWDIAPLNAYHGSVVSVFNRFGTVVFRSVGLHKPWDATYQEKAIPVGTYYYTVDLKNGSKMLAGWLVIIR